ncbi:HI1506-related protein [Marinobacterium sp. MBR-109]|jgi:hypothetical protein|uniref:HI1506-related protein n=1 Tax=Marinobacterium sp. MBR-109 TaxID=3156462 RepID=UPI003396F74D
MPIRISSAINGFRRAGVAHPSKPTVYPDGFFSDDQIKQLKAEPRLAVEFGDFETADPAGAGIDQEGALEPEYVSSDVEPGEGENLLQPLLDIIAKLDPNDPGLWNQDRSPKAANFPKGTSAEDRANAWEMFLAQAGEA